MRLLRSLAFLSLALVIPAAAQLSSVASVPESSDNKRYTFSGTVVNSVTGEPIRRALVTLFYAQQLSAMTDSNGRFEFEDLPRIRTAATAQKPGFFSEQELSGGRSVPNQFSVGPDAPAAVIKLVPEAILFGHIVDPDGLPIPRLMVRAITQKVAQGRKEWQQGMTARTDGDGAFRIIGLTPGSYFLVAGPGRAQAFIAGAEDTSDLGYPAVTYPGNASPIKISAGQQLEASLTIKPEPFYNVTGSVTGTSPAGRYGLQLIPRIPGVRMPISGAEVDSETGTFTLPRVARGDYLLQARGFKQVPSGHAGDYEQQMFGTIPITVHGNLMGVSVPLQPMLTIPVRVRVERTRQAPVIPGGRIVPGVQVRLISDDQGRPQAFSAPEDPKDPSSPLVMRNTLPGHYRIELQPTFGDTYVASARFGTTDLLDGEITLSGSANQGVIDVLIRDDAARLTVKVQSDEMTRASILVISDRGDPKLTETTAGPNDSRVMMGGLRPGNYTVLAFEDLGNLEYMNREALEPYFSRGLKITLAPNQESTVTPELIKRGSE